MKDTVKATKITTDASARDADACTRDAAAESRGTNHPHATADRQAAAEDRRHSAEDREALTTIIDSLNHDELTGAYGRNAGLTELERQVTQAHRTHEPFTITFIDIDHLKETNDTLGHEGGDELITRVAHSIQAVIREYDLTVRYGGDEFISGALGMNLTETRERFTQLNPHLAANGGGTASTGIAQLRKNETLTHLINRADTLMYQHKRHTQH